MEEKISGITLTNGQPATEYIEKLPEKHREVAAQAILNLMKKGWAINDMHITIESRIINRKRRGMN